MISAMCKAQTCAIAEGFCLSTQILDAEDFAADITMDPRQMRAAHRNDQVIGTLYPFVNCRVKPELRSLSPGKELRALLKEFSYLVIRRGVIHRKTSTEDKERWQIVLPKEYHPHGHERTHDDIGHLGQDKTLELVRDRYFWPGMTADVEEKVRECESYLCRKAPTDVCTTSDHCHHGTLAASLYGLPNTGLTKGYETFPL